MLKSILTKNLNTKIHQKDFSKICKSRNIESGNYSLITRKILVRMDLYLFCDIITCELNIK